MIRQDQKKDLVFIFKISCKVRKQQTVYNGYSNFRYGEVQNLSVLGNRQWAMENVINTVPHSFNKRYIYSSFIKHLH